MILDDSQFYRAGVGHYAIFGWGTLPLHYVARGRVARRPVTVDRVVLRWWLNLTPKQRGWYLGHPSIVQATPRFAHIRALLYASEDTHVAEWLL